MKTGLVCLVCFILVTGCKENTSGPETDDQGTTTVEPINWTHTNGTVSGTVRALALMPNGSGGVRLFAGTTLGGVFFSDNNGDSWTAANAGLPTTIVVGLVTSGSVLIAALEDPNSEANRGIYRSTNSGTSWSKTDVDSLFVTGFGVSGNRIYAATWAGGIFISTDEGSSWATANTGLGMVTDPGFPNFEAFAFSGSKVLAGSYGSGLYVSSDNGTSWTSTGAISGNSYIFSFAQVGSSVYATTGDGISRTTDDGATWNSVSSGLTSAQIGAEAAIAASGKYVIAGSGLAGGGAGAFWSSDSGATWTLANSGLTNKNIWSLVVSESVVFAGTEDGVFRGTIR